MFSSLAEEIEYVESFAIDGVNMQMSQLEEDVSKLEPNRDVQKQVRFLQFVRLIEPLDQTI